MIWAQESGAETRRGKTRYNGSQAHCYGKCHAAHASFTSTLKDDMLEQIREVISEEGMENLSSFQISYLCRRFDLDELPESEKELVKIIDSMPKKKREISFDSEEYRGNATFENPYSSNRLDCRLERRLRVREDELALACTEQRMTAETAMRKFSQDYQELLSQFISNIDHRRGEFIRFVELEKAILRNGVPAEMRYADFIKDIRSFLDVRRKLSVKLPGVPTNLEKEIRFFHSKSVYTVLEELAANFDAAEKLDDALGYYELVKDQLDVHIRADVDKIREDLINRLSEATIQLEKLQEATEDIPHLRKLYFGVMRDDPVRHTPSKEELQAQLLEQMDVRPVHLNLSDVD